MSARRAIVIDRLVGRLVERNRARPFSVAVDGRCGAGKTQFGHELGSALEQSGESVVRLDSDAFHHLSHHRRRRVDDQARGYYEDAYDLRSLARDVLQPLRSGDYTIRTAVCDFRADQPAHEMLTVQSDTIVLFECTFVQRPVLRRLWDLVVMLDVSPTIAHERAVARDTSMVGDRSVADRLHRERYGAAWRLYETDDDPVRRADIVIDHDDPQAPEIERW